MMTKTTSTQECDMHQQQRIFLTTKDVVNLTKHENTWVCQGCSWINSGGEYCYSCNYPRTATD